MIKPTSIKTLAIIPLYQGEEFIANCLSSLENGTVKTHILIVDNAYSDQYTHLVEHQFKNVIFIKNKKNLGFGKAINQGFSYGLQNNYTHYLILNQDVELQHDTLQKMLDFASQLDQNEWGIICPWNLGSDAKQTEYYFEENLSKRAGKTIQSNLYGSNVLKVDFINAACWLVNSKALEKLKGFDSRFFMYGEDLDFCNRAKYFGYKIYVLLDVKCFHHKLKGDYENNLIKMAGLERGALLAWYLNPNISLQTKIWHFFKVNLVCIKLIFQGKFSTSFKKFILINRIICLVLIK